MAKIQSPMYEFKGRVWTQRMESVNLKKNHESLPNLNNRKENILKKKKGKRKERKETAPQGPVS